MEETKSYAVVTGANKGIGFEICRQLASNGITVMLTARDEKRGLEAVQKLRDSGFDNLVFHQLDVADPASIQSLADFITRQFGKLDILNIPNEWAKEVLNDAENLTAERVNEVLSVFLNDFKKGSLEIKGWPHFMLAYTLSKAAMNAYTRILIKKYPNFYINCVSPGYVKTDITYNTGVLPVEEGTTSPMRLALLLNGGPFGFFFAREELSSSKVEEFQPRIIEEVGA